MTVGGDGGMSTTNNEEIANKIRSIRDKRKNIIKLRHPVAPPTRSYGPRRYNRSKEKQAFLQDLKEVYNV